MTVKELILKRDHMSVLMELETDDMKMSTVTLVIGQAYQPKWYAEDPAGVGNPALIIT